MNNKTSNKNLSLRYSEYESIETIKKFINNVGWVWIDTFNYLPINKKANKILKNLNLVWFVLKDGAVLKILLNIMIK